MTADTGQTVELFLLHQVQHDRIAYAPYTLLTLNAKDAQCLIDCGAAQLAALPRPPVAHVLVEKAWNTAPLYLGPGVRGAAIRQPGAFEPDDGLSDLSSPTPASAAMVDRKDRRPTPLENLVEPDDGLTDPADAPGQRDCPPAPLEDGLSSNLLPGASEKAARAGRRRGS